MKLRVLLMTVLVGLLVSACGASSDTQAVTQVVTDSATAAENAMQGKGTLADVEQYFANTLESGNIDTQMPAHIAFSAALANPPGKPLRMSNFTINAVSVNPQSGEARVMYQIDITVWNGAVPTTTTVTQNLLVVKTPSRGWRIQGGDGPTYADNSGYDFLGNLMGQ